MSPSDAPGTLNIRVAATINGEKHGLQFHSAEVTQNLFEPCTLRVEVGFDEVDTDKVFKKAQDWIGGSLALTISDISNKNVEKKLTGVITSYSFTYVSLILEAKSEDYKLMEGRRYQTFSNMKLHDIVNKIVNDKIKQSSLTSPASSTEYPVFQQFGETDYDFLKRLAYFDGALFYHDGEQFVYDKKLGGRKEIQLGIEEFDNIVLGCQVGITKWKSTYYNVEKHNDPGGGTEQSQKAPLRSGNDLVKKMHTASENVFGGTTDELYHTPYATSGDAGKLARNRDLDAASRLVKLEGDTLNPLVAIGRTISCDMDPILKTPMVVTLLSAAFRDNVYKAHFEAVPVDSLILPPEVQSFTNPTYLQLGKVIDNKDDKKIGRVKVQFHWSNEIQTGWAPVMQPGAGGPGHGMHFTPRVGDQVLVGFENGEPTHPVVLGAMYNSESKPDFITENGIAEVLVAKTPNSTIRINETSDKEEILLCMDKTKNIFRMELKQPQITLESLDGTIIIHAKDIKITADDHIDMQAKEISMKAEKNIKLTTGDNFEASVGGDQKLMIKGKSESTIAGDAITKVGGKSDTKVSSDFSVTASSKVEIQAGSEAKLAAGAKVGIQGSMVESTAAATNTIKGAMVMIN